MQSNPTYGPMEDTITTTSVAMQSNPAYGTTKDTITTTSVVMQSNPAYSGMIARKLTAQSS